MDYHFRLRRKTDGMLITGSAFRMKYQQGHIASVVIDRRVLSPQLFDIEVGLGVFDKNGIELFIGDKVKCGVSTDLLEIKTFGQALIFENRKRKDWEIIR